MGSLSCASEDCCNNTSTPVYMYVCGLGLGACDETRKCECRTWSNSADDNQGLEDSERQLVNGGRPEKMVMGVE